MSTNKGIVAVEVKKMSEDGKNIIALLQQLRRLCEEIGLLLGTADRLMSDVAWSATDINYVFAGLKYTLANPRLWIPQDFFRFYRNDKFGHVLAFVSVVLDDEKNASTLKEPLLTAGWFDYSSGNQVSKWDYQ
jgi:hypothetical protein